MKKPKIKLDPAPITRSDAEAVMRRLAIDVNNQRAILAARDAAVLAINSEYESALGELTLTIQATTAQLRAWAEANPDQFPAGRKSLSMASGVLGWHIGNPTVKLYSRAFTWQRVLDLLLARHNEFVRTSHEIDKEAILAAKPDAETLRTMGLKITQDERFYADPALSDTPTRQTQEAA